MEYILLSVFFGYIFCCFVLYSCCQRNTQKEKSDVCEILIAQ